MELGDRIEELRIQQGLSVRGLAKKAGVSPSLICHVKNKRNKKEKGGLSLTSLNAIAQALGVSASDLLEDSPLPANMNPTEESKAAILGEKIRLLREELGMSIEALSNACGMSPLTFLELEAGEGIILTDEQVQKIANALQVDSRYLLYDLRFDPRALVDIPPEILAFLAQEDYLFYVHLAVGIHNAHLPPASEKKLKNLFVALAEMHGIHLPE